MVNKVLITSAKDSVVVGNLDYSMVWEKPFMANGYMVDIIDYNKGLPSDIDSYNKIANKIFKRKIFDFMYKKADNNFIQTLKNNKYNVFLNFNNKNIKKNLLITLRNKFPDMKMVNVFADNPFFYSNVLDTIELYDVFYVKDEYVLRELKKVGYTNVKYMAAAFSSDMLNVANCTNMTAEEKNYYGADVSFIGSLYPQRVKILESIDKSISLKLWGGSVWESVNKNSWILNHRMKDIVTCDRMNKAVAMTKINLNTHNYQNDIEGTNTRTFETLGCGGFLLSDYKKAIEKHFVIGKEVVVYNDIKEMNELINYYLNNDEERKEIQLQGYKKAMDKHSFHSRTEQLLSDLK